MDELEKNADDIIRLMLALLRLIQPQLIARDLSLGRAEMQAVRALMYIDGCDMTKFAAGVGISQPTASLTVDKLVESGLVIREDEPSDRRVTLIRLTERGRALAEAVTEAYRDHLLENVGNLEPAEQRKLVSLLSKALGD